MQFVISTLVTLTLGFSLLQCGASNVGVNKDVAQNTANAANNSTAQNADDAPRISLADAKKEFDDDTAIFADTRQVPSFDNEHIKGAINLSADLFEAHYAELPKDKKIIAYCSCGHEESSVALVNRLRQKGYTNAYALTGGTPAWKSAGFPLESSAAKQ